MPHFVFPSNPKLDLRETQRTQRNSTLILFFEILVYLLQRKWNSLCFIATPWFCLRGCPCCLCLEPMLRASEALSITRGGAGRHWGSEEVLGAVCPQGDAEAMFSPELPPFSLKAGYLGSPAGVLLALLLCGAGHFPVGLPGVLCLVGSLSASLALPRNCQEPLPPPTGTTKSSSRHYQVSSGGQNGPLLWPLL